jgi:prepilin-type N-terminal cleavage/methylation domain-containing protein
LFFESFEVVKVARLKSGFTLVEMLVVISILGVLAALTVPALKNIGKSDANVSASRQLLDGIGRARQLAVANRTTVYMVFVPTNFWYPTWMDMSGNYTTTWNNQLTPAQRSAATNLCDKQLTGYNFISYGTLGDQPGQHNWHYLGLWQNLPDGTFTAWQKFYETNLIVDPISGVQYAISEFSYTNNIPFPTETSASGVSLPYIAFNSFGQLVSARDEYIPLAQGSVSPAIDATTKALQFSSPSISETPPGNSTNISYSIVHIDALTGRAVLEHHKLQ